MNTLWTEEVISNGVSTMNEKIWGYSIVAWYFIVINSLRKIPLS